jgi:signal transduction histidine kinase
VRYLHLIAAAALLCGVGSSAVPASAAEFGTKDEAVALVKMAIARVAEVGIDKAVPEFMDHAGKYVDRDLYLTVIDKDGIRIAHGQNPKLVGKSYYESVDVDGKDYGKEAMQIFAGPGKGWISFVFKDPVTGKVLPKEAYIEKVGDYGYITGVYIR